jgi:hypothetical protein
MNAFTVQLILEHPAVATATLMMATMITTAPNEQGGIRKLERIMVCYDALMIAILVSG